MSDLPAVPDYYGQFMAPLQRQQQINIEQQNANLQQSQVAMQEQQQTAKLRQLQAFQSDAQSVISNPTPEGYRSLMLKYPDQYEGIKASWGEYSDAQKETDVNAAGQVYASLSNGRSDLALQLLNDRKSAEVAAGKDTKMTDSMIDLVSSGDPTKLKQAQGIAGFVLASSAGPDKIGTTLNALGQIGPDGKGQVVGRAIGHYENGAFKVDYRDPDAPQYREVQTVDKDGNPVTQIVRVGGDGQAAPSAPGGFANAVQTVLHNEGGYAPSDMNGKPVNMGINQGANPDVNVKNLTRDQAIQLYHDRYWVPSGAENLPANMQTPYFDVYVRNPKFAKVALAKSGGDPAQFMQLAQDYFQKLAQKPGNGKYAAPWANRDANNLAIATGQGGAPDASAAQATPVYSAPGANGGVQLPGDATKQGTDYLATIPNNVAAQVKALVEGRLPMPSSFALSKPYWQKMIAMATQYDPSWDANTAATRKAAMTAFTGNGKAAQVIGSVNRVANHLDLLWNESNRLSGPNTGFGPLNSALATVGQSFQPNDAKAYDTEVTFVAGELGKIAKAGVVTEGEVDKIIANLGRRNSLDTRQAAIKAAVGIISGAVDPLKDQYNSAFTNDSVRPHIPWVSPAAQKVYSKIGGVDMSLTGAGADTNAPAGNNSPRRPPPGATKTATGPNGQKAALVNGHWVIY